MRAGSLFSVYYLKSDMNNLEGSAAVVEAT